MNQIMVLRILSNEPGAVRQFEVGEFETWRDRATDQSVFTDLIQTGAEPVPRGHHTLKLFTRFGILAQLHRAVIPGGIDDMNEQGVAGIEMPDLICSQAMKSRKIFSSQQEENRCRRVARAAERTRQTALFNNEGSLVSLPEEPAFGMRLEL